MEIRYNLNLYECQIHLIGGIREDGIKLDTYNSLHISDNTIHEHRLGFPQIRIGTDVQSERQEISS